MIQINTSDVRGERLGFRRKVMTAAFASGKLPQDVCNADTRVIQVHVTLFWTAVKKSAH